MSTREGDAGAMAPVKRRVAALDQFRGYTMAGMFLVNFIGGYAAVHAVFKHHNTYCSYADTIMPGFFFAVGFSFRLSYLRREREAGHWGAVGHAVWRNAKLFLIGFLAYNTPNFQGLWNDFRAGSGAARLEEMLRFDTFQALVHIAVTSLWILPVAGRSRGVVWAALVFTCLLHIANLHFFYYGYGHGNVIDGGPLGFVGWAVPTLIGVLVCDALRRDASPRGQFRTMGPWAVGFMLAGYALSCLNLLDVPGRMLLEPPFTPPTAPVDMWTMDQQVASPSYMLFGGGFSLAVYLLFVLVSDVWGFQLGVFRTLGKNPLFGYLYHSVIGALVGLAIADAAPLWQVMLAFSVYFAIVWATLRIMEWRNWYWRL